MSRLQEDPAGGVANGVLPQGGEAIVRDASRRAASFSQSSARPSYGPPVEAPRETLTSFGLLKETSESQDSGFGIGNIFSRVRSAFGSSEGDIQSTASVKRPSTLEKASSGSVPPTQSRGSVPEGTSVTANADSNKSGIAFPSQRATSSSESSAAPHARQESGQSHPTSSRKSGQKAAAAPNVSVRNLLADSGRVGKNVKAPRQETYKARPPFSVVSSSFAPAVTSTAAAHAVAPRRFQSITAATLEEEDEDSEDVLSTLMRKSGIDSSRRKDNHFSSIPGFPLNNDLIADDARSVYSTSSRMPRSESFSTSETHLVSAQRASNNRGGLETSADAFRRMRGEGTVLSREYWMPDESVKECRECQSYFTPLRRKHHCRICGLVYCSRCASHILPGSRFGLDRADIRVCNFCLRVLSEYERAGRHADGRSGDPSTPTLAGSPQRVATTFARKRVDSGNLASRPDKESISGPLEIQSKTPQSQFAANQLFSTRSGADGSALAFAQAVPRMDSLQDMLAELEQEPRVRRALTTRRRDEEHEALEQVIPFRVKLGDEDKIPAYDDGVEPHFSPSSADLRNTAKGESATSANSEAVPKARGRETSRARHLGGSGIVDLREKTVGDAALRALRKSKLKAREQAMGSIRPGVFPSGRRDSLPSAIGPECDELDLMAVRHLSILLDKLLVRADVPRRDEWKASLEPLIRKVIRRIHPHPKNGESMDIRQYIKFKRVAGGKISDSEYVDGFVLSKQVATKRMTRLLPLSNPRIMVLAFPVDFHRAEEQFMSLGPVLSQEHEYTRILVARILQLRPNVLVVKDTVSRLALDLLEDAGVVVVWNLKMSALQAISRCCQADIITSAERIAVDPRLGRCSHLSVETFQHAQYSQCRKSLMRFTTSGNSRNLGCSIVLRGSNLNVLGSIKQIMSLLVFVSHNLRLEAHLNRDEGAQISIGGPLGDDRQRRVSVADALMQDQDERADSLWEQIVNALEPFKQATLTSSVGMLIPPPYQLVRMKDAHKRLKLLEQDSAKEQCKSRPEIGASDTTKEGTEDETAAEKDEHAEYEKGAATDEKAERKAISIEQSMPKPSGIQAEYSRALVEHQLHLKDWEQSTQKDPTTSLQRISVLWTMISTTTHKPCIGPRLITTSFYGQGDETLGQYLERTCSESTTLCPAKGCARPRAMHYSSFVHNDTRVQVVLERFVCPIPGQENNLLMWSYCKLCERATPVTPVSDDTWAISFAKYLELHFYDGDKVTTMCGHDFYGDFIRFFSLQNLALRFHRDRDIVVRDVILPPMRLLSRPDVDYALKLESAQSLQQRMTAYWTSVFERMAALRKEPCLSVHNIVTLETAMKNAHEDEEEVTAFFIETMSTSKQTDILVLNKVRNRLQASVVRWDQFFQEFERTALPSEREVRRLTGHHLSSVFAQEKAEDGAHSDVQGKKGSGLAPPAEAEEDDIKSEKASTDTLADTEARRGLSHSASSPSNMTALATAAQAQAESVGEPSSSSLLKTETTAGFSLPSDAGVSPPGKAEEAPTGDGMDSDEKDVEEMTKAVHSEVTTEIDTSAVRSGSSDTECSLSRPTMRRGKTADDVLKSARKKLTAPRLNSTGRVLPNSPTTGRRSEGSSRKPPSSFRPPKATKKSTSSNAETESDGSMSAASFQRKLTLGKRKGRLQAFDAAKLSDGTKSPRHDRPHSRMPMLTSRVSSLARRFDNMQKEAERERERQKLVRARRARPVLASQPTIQVYHSLREAVRDEESDTSDEDDSAGEAGEDEDEADSEGEQESPERKRESRRPQADQANEGQNSLAAGADKVEVQVDNVNEAQLPDAPKLDEGAGAESAATADEVSIVPKEDKTAERRAEVAPTELTMTSFLSGTIPASWRASLMSDGETGDGRGSILKALSSLWARGSLHLPPIELPMRTTEHLFTDSPLVVLREDEPSSLIAFTLSSTAYAGRLEALRTPRSPHKEKSDNASSATSRDAASVLSTEDERGIAATLRKTEGTHLSFQFSSGDSRFAIRVLFTEQFDAMRRACDQGQIFVQSLSRCSNWADCSGGKSGVAMMKTLDDRFVIKQLSRAEMDAFASNAGAYFRFLADVLFQDRPTTLAKIYGVYRLTIKNMQTGKSIKLDCAIAENVFANAKMAQTYDLKGALRNRFVQPSGQPNQVLLDGNLITAKTPIYLREGSKRLLRQALYHDSLFLANCDVMDYSLVVGVCDGTAELRVGIIDFIRTFTFGKKAESFIKEAVGGGTEAPTIIDPKQYRARFLAFLESVLLLSPDHWLSDEEVRAQQTAAHAAPATTAALHTTTHIPPSTPSSQSSNAPPSSSLLALAGAFSTAALMPLPSQSQSSSSSATPMQHAHSYSIL